jgi:hypothetical protein
MLGCHVPCACMAGFDMPMTPILIHHAAHRLCPVRDRDRDRARGCII